MDGVVLFIRRFYLKINSSGYFNIIFDVRRGFMG